MTKVVDVWTTSDDGTRKQERYISQEDAKKEFHMPEFLFGAVVGAVIAALVVGIFSVAAEIERQEDYACLQVQSVVLAS